MSQRPKVGRVEVGLGTGSESLAFQAFQQNVGEMHPRKQGDARKLRMNKREKKRNGEEQI